MAVKAQVDSQLYGTFRFRDHTPSGRISGVIVGSTGPQGGISSTPGIGISYAIRRALDPKTTRPASVCKVYDKSGKLVALIDPETRERIEIRQ